MKIIVLQGLPNTGKTETLNLVYQILTPNPQNVISWRSINPNTRDFEAVFLYHGQRIGIYTEGDYSNRLANAIWRYAEIPCDYFICALSTNTPKIRANLAINNFRNERIDKEIAMQRNRNAMDVSNQRDAERIIHLLNTWIDLGQ